MQTLRYAILVVLGFLLPLAAQRWDRRRLSDEQRQRAWNTATWGAALYAFSVFSMIPWLWVTRYDAARWRRRGRFFLVLRSVALLGQGVLAAIALFAVLAGCDALLSAALGDGSKPY